jgi:hypothetical protein
MAFGKKTDTVAVIQEANMLRTTIRIKGTAPLVINKFSKKARDKMMADMSTPASEKKGKNARAPRDYEADFMGARHISEDGWDGISASAFRIAMIDACRTVNAVMVRAKMSLSIISDGIDKDEGTPLVKIISKDGPEKNESLVRNDNGGADVRIRPMWREWGADVCIEFDADMITGESVVNLLDRAGRQVGICEGRPFSKDSCGMGWGTFQVVAK